MQCGWLACHSGRPKVLADVPLVPRLDDDLDPPHGRPAPLASDTGAAGAVALLRALPVPLGVRIDHARGRVRAGARTSRAGDPSRGPSTIAALVLESVTGGSGVIVPPTGYLRGVRDLCTRHGIVYIADEVLVGFSHTGAWFAIDHDGVAQTSWFSRKASTRVRAARRRIGRRFGVRDLHATSVSGGPDLQRAPAHMRSRCRRDPSHARRGHCRRSLASRRGHPRARAREACREPPLRGGRSWHRRTVGTPSWFVTGRRRSRSSRWAPPARRTRR